MGVIGEYWYHILKSMGKNIFGVTFQGVILTLLEVMAIWPGCYGWEGKNWVSLGNTLSRTKITCCFLYCFYFCLYVCAGTHACRAHYVCEGHRTTLRVVHQAPITSLFLWENHEIHQLGLASSGYLPFFCFSRARIISMNNHTWL